MPIAIGRNVTIISAESQSAVTDLQRIRTLADLLDKIIRNQTKVTAVGRIL